MGGGALDHVLFVRPPTVNTIKQLMPTGELRDIVGLTLIRGATYVVSGSFLNVVGPGGLVLQTGSVPQNGILIVSAALLTVSAAPTSGPASTLQFTIPTTATNGLLTITTVAGTVAVGTFSIVNP